MQLSLRRVIRPTSPHAFDLLRIGLSLVLIAKTIVELPSLFVLYGRYGVVQWPLSEAVLDPGQPRLSWMLGPAARLGISADTMLLLVIIAYLASLLLSALGLGTRYFTALAWFCQNSLDASAHLMGYGVDFFATSGLFYCALAPVGRLSLDHFFWKKTFRETYWATALLRILQLQVCFVYFDSGLVKMFGRQWWSGEAIWALAQHPLFHAASVTHSYDWSLLAQHPWIAQTASVSAIIVEATYPFAMLFAVRHLWIDAIILMHVCIALFLGLWFFSGIMIVFNIAAFSRVHPRTTQRGASSTFVRRMC